MTRHEELHHLKRVLNRHRDALRAVLVFYRATSDATRRDVEACVGTDKVVSRKALIAFIRDVLQDDAV